MSKVVVRDYRPEDRAAVRRISFETGLNGDPIVGQYDDEESFADATTAYYTDVEPHNAVVAECEGRVIGYMVACRDSRAVWSQVRIALRHVLTRGLAFRRGTAAFYWRGLWDMITDLFRTRRPYVDLSRFPSHTHNNLLPEGRGSNASVEFSYRIFDKLKRAGSPGLHGEALATDKSTLDFAERMLGYRVIGKPYPLPGMRTPNGERVMLIAAVRDLTSWEPEAWLRERQQYAAPEPSQAQVASPPTRA
jgi:hypothetical protein